LQHGEEKGIEMQHITVKQVDAFTTRPFCGNPAGVITEADGLSRDMMQKIAGEMNLSETAFVSMAETEDTLFRIHFFTPSEEVDLSGHVTIATCFALVEEGRIPLENGVTKMFLDTNIGRLPVDIYFQRSSELGAPADGDEGTVPLVVDGITIGSLEKIMMHQPIKGFRPSNVPIGEISAILGIDEDEIFGSGLPLEIVSTGLSQLMVPVKRKETVLSMNPDLIKLALMNKKVGIDTNHIFTLDTFNTESVSYSRHFAPAVGMWEDPATGTAAAGLGTYLIRHGVVTSCSMVMEQGKEIDSLANILVEVDEAAGEISSVQIGGLAVTSITRTIQLESGEVIIA
jgi:predicted PhzF superfamily epimerase YddE/YHI9